MKSERLARIVLIILTAGIGIAVIVFRVSTSSNVIEVHAAMPDKGGWLTPNINARVGEPLNLRLISDDVVHSFAIGQFDFEPVDLYPGKPADVTLTFNEPRTYTFYCTRWCGKDHWRMRGTITVLGDNHMPADDPSPALYMTLGINIDERQDLSELSLYVGISPARGQELGIKLPPEIRTQLYYRSYSPFQAWNDLRDNPISTGLSDSQVWDVVASLWNDLTTPEKLAQGQKLYERDCAACHGSSGKGDGVFAVYKELADENSIGVEYAQSTEEPADFTDPTRILGASSALLQGKILRGGMGTGMPSWGLVYTDQQTWALVDYLWTFIFNNIEE